MKIVFPAVICLAIASPSHSAEEMYTKVLSEGEPCRGVIQDVEYEIGSKSNSESHLFCELESGEMYSMDISPSWVEEQIAEGAFVSGETELMMPEGSVINYDSGMIEMTKMPSLSTPYYDLNRRKLNQEVEGDVTVLVVRVRASNKSTSNSIDALTNSVFGNDPRQPDPVTMKSQYFACSHGKLNFIEAPQRDGRSANIRQGGTTISINVSTGDGDSKMVNAITKELNSQFNVRRPSDLADHVMYCLPKDTMSGIAYAYVNSWNSVYDDDWCMKVSAQVHEIGHNLGLSHSNEGGESYEDRSGMMGYSYSNDNSPRMCFNAAKSWKLGWYKERHQVVGVSNPSYIGKLSSVTDDPDKAGPPMLIKILSPRRGGEDMYLNFNLGADFNSETKEGRDKVLIVARGKADYAESDLKAKLDTGEDYRISNFDGDGNAITVEVSSISTADKVADVRVCLGSCPTRPQPTNAPTERPTTRRFTDAPTVQVTDAPTESPTLRRFTETPTQSPTTTIVQSTRAPTNSPTNNPTKFPSRTPTVSPPSSCTDTDPELCAWVKDDILRCAWRAPGYVHEFMSDLCPSICDVRCNHNCRDMDFFFFAGNTKTCDWVSQTNRCFSTRAQMNCPMTCGLCKGDDHDPEPPVTPPPTSSPTKSSPIRCYDAVKKIPIVGHSEAQYCSWVEEDLDRCSLRSATFHSEELSAFCPVTCRMDCQCYDEEYFYYRRERRRVMCDSAMAEGLCGTSKARSFCPIACGVCEQNHDENYY